MKKYLHITSFLVFTLSGMHISAMRKGNPFQDILGKNDQEFLLKEEQDEKFWRTYAASKELLEFALSQAPEGVEGILDKINHPKKHRLEKRFGLLYGPPGTGKTLLMKAIAYKTKSHLIFKHCSELHSIYMHGTSANLHNTVKEGLDYSNNQKVIIALDEIQALTNNYENQNNDAEENSRALMSVFEQIVVNPNIFILCATNCISKMLKPLQNRFDDTTISVPLPNTRQRKAQLLFHLQDENLDQNCDDAYLTSLAKKIKGFGARDIQDLLNRALSKSKRANVQNRIGIYSPKYLEEAYQYQLQEKAALDYDREEISEQERFHRETLEMQERHHRESIQKQDECQQKQDEHHRESIQKQDEHHRESIQIQENHHQLSLAQNNAHKIENWIFRGCEVGATFLVNALINKYIPNVEIRNTVRQVIAEQANNNQTTNNQK